MGYEITFNDFKVWIMEEGEEIENQKTILTWMDHHRFNNIILFNMLIQQNLRRKDIKNARKIMRYALKQSVEPNSSTLSIFLEYYFENEEWDRIDSILTQFEPIFESHQYIPSQFFTTYLSLLTKTNRMNVDVLLHVVRAMASKHVHLHLDMVNSMCIAFDGMNSFASFEFFLCSLKRSGGADCG